MFDGTCVVFFYDETKIFILITILETSKLIDSAEEMPKITEWFNHLNSGSNLSDRQVNEEPCGPYVWSAS